MSLPFTNDVISLDSLPRYEIAETTKIHSSYWKVIQIHFAIILVLAGAAIFLFVQLSDLPRRWFAIPAFCVVWLGFLLVYKLSFNKRSFALRQHDLLYRRGILATITTVIPFSRIQHIAINEGVISRRFGLAQLIIYTAGGANMDLSISGLLKQDAEKMKQLIMDQHVESFADTRKDPENEERNDI